MATKKKLQGDQLYRSLMTFFGAGGAHVEAGSEWRGDSEIVKLHPQFFALSAGGQQAIDQATQALRVDIGEAAANRELQWYGPKQPEPEPSPRVVCIKGFIHRGQPVEPGTIWLANHETVSSAPSAFVAVLEDD